MTRFSNFTDVELDALEEALYIQGLLLLVGEIQKERRYREERKVRESRL